MNGTRMNQLVAPTSFITSISRRRENMAMSDGVQDQQAAEASRHECDADQRDLQDPREAHQILHLVLGVSDVTNPGPVVEPLAHRTISSAFAGTTRNDGGRPRHSNC